MSDEKFADRRRLGSIITFDVLHLLAMLILTTVLITAWRSPRIRRVRTWYLYVFSWDLFSLSYLLILGKQTGEKPVWGWCLFQSMMIYATPVLTAASIIAFVTQIYLDIRAALGYPIVTPDLVKKNSMFFQLTMVPWIFFITIVCEVSIIGFSVPSSVGRSPSGMFCRVDLAFPGQVTGITVALCIVLVVLLGVSIGFTVHRNRDPAVVNSREFQSYNFVFRIAVFFLAPLIAVGLLVIKFLPSSGEKFPEFNIVYGIFPTLAGIVSASQKDLWDIWMFWRPSRIDVDKGSV